MENKLNENIKEWLELSNQGLFVEAKNFYFNNIFDDVIDRFVDNTLEFNRCDVLFSILGFTPEPIILTQRALTPKVHVIFTTNKDYENNNEIISYLEKYLTSDYKIVNLPNDTFETIYDNLKAQMNIYPSSQYVIDITGGKKSMVASAAIFAKDYNCNVVYVDYDEYISELRRPKPGTERLNVVYSANNDFVNTIDFKLIDENVQNNTTSYNSSSDSFQEPEFQNKFNNVFDNYVKQEDEGSGIWLPNDFVLKILTKRSIMLSHNETGRSIVIQRAQLRNFFIRCKRKQASASRFVDERTLQAKLFNPVIHGLLNAINNILFKENF